jgi:hypothetical protein
MFPLVRSCVLVASALLASTADAHGRLGLPAPTFIASAQSKPNYWAYGVYAAKNPPAASYAGSQSEPDLKKREQTFDTNFKKNGFTSLKKWIMENQVVGKYDGRPSGGTPECGYTDPNGKEQPLPPQLKWPSPTFQHPGPCEAWCDDEVVIPYQASCNAYAKQGLMDYDKAKCVGKKMLSFYYLAVHVAEPFQVYASCVRLQGARSGAGSANSGTVGGEAKNNTAPATAPKSAAPAPAPVAAPSSAPAPAPASPPAPNAGPSKCNRRD